MRTNQNKWPASPQSSSEKQTRVEDRIGESVLATARIPQASGREEPQNPVKRPPSPKISPETRRPRVEERDESSASVSEPASNGVWENRTVIQLGPSFRGTDPTPVFAPRSAGTSAVQESPPGPAPSDLPVFDDAATDIEQGPEKETTAGVDTELVEDEVATENGQQQIIDRKADQTETRRMAEEAILAQRRKIAEAEARVKAAAELSVRNLEKQKEVDDITRMKRPFSVSVSHPVLPSLAHS